MVGGRIDTQTLPAAQAHAEGYPSKRITADLLQEAGPAAVPAAALILNLTASIADLCKRSSVVDPGTVPFQGYRTSGDEVEMTAKMEHRALDSRQVTLL